MRRLIQRRIGGHSDAPPATNVDTVLGLFLTTDQRGCTQMGCPPELQ